MIKAVDLQYVSLSWDLAIIHLVPANLLTAKAVLQQGRTSVLVIVDSQPVVMALGRSLDTIVRGPSIVAGWLVDVFAEISELVSVRTHDGLLGCVYLVGEHVRNYGSHAVCRATSFFLFIYFEKESS